MAEIVYSPSAIQDLEEIGDYIAETLKSPAAALNTVNKIQGAIGKLADFPLTGAPLSSIAVIDTCYRFIVCGNYIGFFRVQADTVYIDRILYGRRDYLSVLFRDLPQDKSSVLCKDSVED